MSSIDVLTKLKNLWNSLFQPKSVPVEDRHPSVTFVCKPRKRVLWTPEEEQFARLERQAGGSYAQISLALWYRFDTERTPAAIKTKISE